MEPIDFERSNYLSRTYAFFYRAQNPLSRPNMPIRYFIMKSSNLRNLEISQQKGIWSTTPSNERKLNRAFWESSMVYLVFSVQGSGHFQVSHPEPVKCGCSGCRLDHTDENKNPKTPWLFIVSEYKNEFCLTEHEECSIPLQGNDSRDRFVFLVLPEPL